jgi:phosphoribosyl 1,2-cyclic phosphate phosphodiesterase
MDELNGWTPPDLGPLDLAVLPMGILELDPRSGERLIAAEHPVLQAEATFAETLEIVRRLDARRVVLSHVEEMDAVSHDDLRSIGARERVEFAYDTMSLDL